MIQKLIPEKSIQTLKAMINDSENIIITCHVGPDGDAIGSSLGLYHILMALGKNVTVITPDAFPVSLKFLKGSKEIVVYSKYTDFGKQLLSAADLIFCLDFNTLSRVDKMSEALSSSSAKKILIDHHTNPDDFANLIISFPLAPSTSELVFRVISRLGLWSLVTKSCAESIFLGMMTDTGNFTYNANSVDTYMMIAELLRKGINREEIYKKACNTFSADQLRLNGYALSNNMVINNDFHSALITLSKEELNRFNYQKGDTESLVNKPLSIPEVVVSVFLREENDYIKVSTRSKGDYYVNTLCEKYFNGGGHKNASGGEFKGTMQEAIDAYNKAVADFSSQLKK